MASLKKWLFAYSKESKFLPRGDGLFQIIKRINDNAYVLDLCNTYLGTSSFHVSDLTPFFADISNSWTNSLQPREHDETLTYKTSTKTSQPSRRMIRSMTRDPGLVRLIPYDSQSIMP